MLEFCELADKFKSQPSWVFSERFYFLRGQLTIIQQVLELTALPGEYPREIGQSPSLCLVF